MNQSQTVELEVKVCLQLAEQQPLVTKRIQTAQTFKDLLQACQSVTKSADIPKKYKLKVFYRDSDNDKIEVSDDYELQMAYATALSADNKVKFFIEVPDFKPEPVQQVLEVPQVVEPEKIPEPVVEIKPEPVVEIKPEPIVEPVVEKMPEPVVEKQPEPKVEEKPLEYPKIECDLDFEATAKTGISEEPHCRPAKKAKKAKKAKAAGNMPRNAIKNLIRQELESAVPGIFDKLMKDADNLLELQAEPLEETKEEANPVLHMNVECDVCGVCPIKGIRYKCSVRQDYDLCEKCEAIGDQKYPMLKIRKAGGAPSMILAVLNEDQDGNPVEGEADWHQVKHQFKQMKNQMKEQWKKDHPDWKPGHGCGKWHQAKEQWKKDHPEWQQMKQEWKEKHCGKPKSEWTQEDCERKMGFWKHMVGGFLDKMGFDKSEWKGHHGHQKGEYKKKRAVIVSNPDTVLECRPGCVVLHDIEVKNNTHWGWKQGVFLGMDSSIEQTNMPIEVVQVPVESKVEAMQNLKMSVPITVLDSAKPSDEVFEFALRFRGPKGGEIGEPINLKLKIVADAKKAEEPKKSHLELVKLAVKLFDQEKLGQTFNECLEVVTLVNGDEEVAKKSLQPRQ